MSLNTFDLLMTPLKKGMREGMKSGALPVLTSKKILSKLST